MNKSKSPQRTRAFVPARITWLWVGMSGVGLVILVYMLLVPPFSAQANTNTGRPNNKYWSMPQQAIYGKRQAHTDSHPFYLNDKVVMPNGLELQVQQVQRNWQAPAAVTASYGSNHDGDDPTGREVILVWFIAKNVGTKPIVYNDSMFTLQMPGIPEQRIAHLSTLLPSSYGDKGVEPWLLPGQSMTTFVPFLINPGTTPISFQYYIATFSSPSSTQLPELTRLSILLQNAHVLSRVDSKPFTFTADKTTTVGA
jgi:hypothetical protein